MTTDPQVAFGTIADLGRRLRGQALSPRDLVQLFLSRIEAEDGRLHAFITVARPQAMADADAAAMRLGAGDAGPLVGIPVAVKDSVPTRGIRTTANSRVLEDWIPADDAACVVRLRAAGAVIIGKTNLNEFGWSLPHEDDLAPPPRNPWDPARAAIGSSSGSGAAVAAGLCCAALGTDGGGSVRLPAGQMGLVGLKPTHALVSRAGTLHSGSISEIGPMTRTVEDAALLLSVLAGYDQGDPDSDAPADVAYGAALRLEARGLRVGVPWGVIDGLPVEPDIRRAFEVAVDEMARLGVAVRRVDLPMAEEARDANFVVLNAEHYAAHAAALRSRWHRYGRSARLYHAQGAFVSAAEYAAALEIGRLARRAIDGVLGEVDALAMPCSPVVTAEAARRPGSHRRGLNASFTAPFNLTGHPALALPCGLSDVGLPMGLQVVGRRHDEATLLRLGHAYERATPWHTLLPDAYASAGGRA